MLLGYPEALPDLSNFGHWCFLHIFPFDQRQANLGGKLSIHWSHCHGSCLFDFRLFPFWRTPVGPSKHDQSLLGHAVIRLAKEDTWVLRRGGKEETAAANDSLALAGWNALDPLLHRDSLPDLAFSILRVCQLVSLSHFLSFCKVVVHKHFTLAWAIIQEVSCPFGRSSSRHFCFVPPLLIAVVSLPCPFTVLLLNQANTSRFALLNGKT